MGRKAMTLSKLPNPSCRACHGMGAIRTTVHFHTGDHEWEMPCWECYGTDIRLQFPKPRTTDN